MTLENYGGPERRKFPRLDYVTPLDYKVCKEETIEKLLSGYTANVSEAGLLCHLKDQVAIGDILWLAFDRDTLQICETLEKTLLVYQNGVIGKVIRLDVSDSGTYCAGIRFITRIEQNDTHIYPTMHFIMRNIGVPND